MKHISDNEYIEQLIANRGLNGVVELGKRVGEDIVGSIFSKFCVGK